MEKKKDPLMLYVTKEVKELIDKIDKNNFLGLGTHDSSRTELFIFAAALGLEAGVQMPLEKNKESLTRATYLNTNDEALLYSSFIGNLEDEDDLESCISKNNVFYEIEQYANTGFNLLKGMMESKSEESALLERIKILDDKYEKLIDDL